jgi:hypothetical protein
MDGLRLFIPGQLRSEAVLPIEQPGIPRLGREVS